ncbi:glycosyltransferase [Modestobacter sp. VKM Ac-2983]|uniref:glycosyltransferase n=1 Tax=Modestobacter sp. VKM Ac-2983 TaxID=3004137 RepID=UPI0022ABAEB8|nr:glycosyltransferase [Modestobacter sp. VKM Ac-2983]MCZ2803677.1 glycosyltransferase [Modestobacter sp. VKM Ac-2983]
MTGRAQDHRVHLIASLGGHLELLHGLLPALSDRERVWITSEGARAESMRASGERVHALPRLDRSSLRLSAIVAGAVLALRERPHLVITSGAGLAVPFAVVARLLGAQLVFIETMARVTGGSHTGRFLRRCGARVIVQWPDLLRVYPDATVCRPMLLEDVAALGERPGTGTFVTVGSHDVPFHRLLDAVDDAAEDGVLPAPLVVQTGVSARSRRHGEFHQFLSPDEFRAAVEKSGTVVTHGGAGAIATALRNGRMPLVMARTADRGEHVDDHQEQLVSRLDELGAVVQISDRITADMVARAHAGGNLDQGPASNLPSVADALAHLISGGTRSARRPWSRLRRRRAAGG